MARLIDADAFDRDLVNHEFSAALNEAADKDGPFEDMPMYYSVQSFRDTMRCKPTIDAVPVIRCKDCICFVPYNTEKDSRLGKCTDVYLPMNGETVDGWWFCADGEKRRDDETHE